MSDFSSRNSTQKSKKSHQASQQSNSPFYIKKTQRAKPKCSNCKQEGN